VDASILKGVKKAGKTPTVVNLKQRSADKLAAKRGKRINKEQKDGRRWRHDHPLHPHEHDIPKVK
jgi:hypothetical protein